MTKKLVLTFCLFSSVLVPSFAGDSSSGCGLGWQLFPQTSLVSSSLRSTTHSFLPNTFSMTSGTSGCAKHSIVKNEFKAIHFAETNYDALMIDMAKGNGEYLNTFASLTDYKGDMKSFGQFTQQNFQALFPVQQTSASDMVQNFKKLL